MLSRGAGVRFRNGRCPSPVGCSASFAIAKSCKFCVTVGLVASAIAGPLLAHLLYGIDPRDPFTLLAGPSILALVALLAIWLPARRALAMDPMVALRSV
jgi:putative ABC transport system permease protein